MDTALKEKLEQLRLQVETGIADLLPPEDDRPARLHQAMRYSMKAGGKRIRPALLILAAEVLPPRAADPLPAAVAVECLHTYTLIHDDLPSVDNSDLRRGRPACHKAFDEATALLAGDALLTYSFELLARRYADSPALAAALVGDLATAAGSRQLIGGQMEDIANEGQTIEPTTLDYIHANKTAALLTAALCMGLRFGQPESGHLEAMRTAGYHLGMNFQIVDDILDATSDPETMGKPVGHDASAGKSTYVALHGVDGGRAEAARHAREAAAALRQLGPGSRALVELVEAIAARGR